MSVGLKIELEEIEDRVILRIDGRIDAASSPILERKLNSLVEEGRLHLLLDFSRVDYLSSAGMRVLLSLAKKLKKEEGDLVLFSLDDDVFEVIKMAGFERIMQIYSTEKEALQHDK